MLIRRFISIFELYYTTMKNFEYIFCHGSGNRFVMIDTLECPCDWTENPQIIAKVCRETQSDGLLLLCRYQGEHLAMRMFNTDGSEAEMCGNGIRCVARLADERYLHSSEFTLYSGGKPYPITRETPLSDGIPTYGVEISIATHSADFPRGGEKKFLGGEIAELDPDLKFSYLNLGNPHIVAVVDSIDLDHLSKLGERVKELPSIFPNGINVSLLKIISQEEVFVTTYERGVGLTASCGTAMTASSTAACLLGHCLSDKLLKVSNRGGMVHCVNSQQPELKTKLIGNATYVSRGEVSAEGDIISSVAIPEEQELWLKLVDSINN